MLRRFAPDLRIVLLLVIPPLLLFWQQTLGGRTLLPADNLYQFEPWASYREQVGAPARPHNASGLRPGAAELSLEAVFARKSGSR